MTFIWMPMLWLLLIVPALVGLYVWLMRRRKKAALRYANLTVVREAMGRGPGWRRHVPPALLLAAIAVLILAVARPAAILTLPSSRATIILAMDVSGSMRAPDVNPSRLAASEKAAKQFIADQPSDVQIGIVAFASTALLVQTPTIDHQALNDAIDRFQLRWGTAVGDGLLVALNTIFPEERFALGPDDRRFGGMQGNGGGNNRGFGRGYESRSLDQRGSTDNRPPHVPVKPGSYPNAVIILLTDGATTTGSDPIQAGQMAADYGVRVYTVGFGAPDGDVVNFGGYSMRARPDIDTLKKIADTTDAQFFSASSADDLKQVYKSLSAKLTTEKKLTEISFVFAGVGALLALIAGALSVTWFGRIV